MERNKAVAYYAASFAWHSVLNLCFGLAKKKTRLNTSTKACGTWRGLNFFSLAVYENRHMNPDPAN